MRVCISECPAALSPWWQVKIILKDLGRRLTLSVENAQAGHCGDACKLSSVSLRAKIKFPPASEKVGKT